MESYQNLQVNDVLYGYVKKVLKNEVLGISTNVGSFTEHVQANSLSTTELDWTYTAYTRPEQATKL